MKESSQPLCGSKMSLPSSQDHYSRNPVQVTGGGGALETVLAPGVFWVFCGCSFLFLMCYLFLVGCLQRL